MKFKSVLLSFLVLLTLTAKTQSNQNVTNEGVFYGHQAMKIASGAEMVRFSPRSTAPNFIRLRSDYPLDMDVLGNWMVKTFHFGSNDGVKLLNEEEDGLGFNHIRFTQKWNQYPVEGSMLIVHLKDGMVVSVNGDFFPDITAPSSPGIAEENAFSLALSHISAKKYMWESVVHDPDLGKKPKGELVVVPFHGDYRKRDFRLAWKFNIYAADPLSRANYFVDAHSGEIIFTQELIHTADVLGSAQTVYSGNQPITADFTGTNYRLRETGRGNGVETYNLNNGDVYGAATDFFDNNNVWTDVNDEYGTDAHWGAEMTYDFFLAREGRNSIDGNGFALKSYVHYDVGYNNAFWDGQVMTYGDGDGTTFTPLTAIDVTGHEITHGLTSFTANLIYSYESGALNESFSDIFGSLVENFARPAQWNWLIGEDMTPSGNGIRNMANPNAFGDPDTYLGTNWYAGAGDNGGVHTNSGVQNHWFHILADGKVGTNDNGDNYNVTGIGKVNAGHIAFRNLTVYLTPNSEYDDARLYAIQSAIDLFGPCVNEVIQTTNAWYAVGVGGPFSFSVVADFSANPQVFCTAPATVSFSNLSTNAGTFLWDFGDGNTSTSFSPSHTYLNLGNYTVSLVAYGGPCGDDSITRVAYISVDTSNACLITLGTNGPGPTQTTCSGTLFDSGGPNGNYQDNTYAYITIAPAGASQVNLTFNSFHFEDNYDYLSIFDGPSVNSPLIGTYTGTNLPNGGSISSTGGSITILQETDQSVVEFGFEMDWNCVYPSTPPVTDFIANTQVTCSGEVVFTDLSTNGPVSWLWNFGDGNTSTQQNPTHTYQANGAFTVSLTSNNAFGPDSETKTAYITVNKPSAPATTGASRCGPGTLTLSATGPGDFSWFNVPSGGNSIGTGPSFSTGILANTTPFYVEERISPTPQNAGPPNNTFGAGGNFTNSGRYLFFDVIKPCKLISVLVYSGASGQRTIEWRGPGQNVIQDTTLTIPSGTQRVTLNFDLVPGTNYALAVNGSGINIVDLYRNSSNAAYPYILPGVISITGSNAGQSGYYYFFYDWEIQEEPCISERATVTATINPFPNVGVTPGPNVNFCAGDSVELTAFGALTYLWSNGASGAGLQVSSGGTYSVVGTDANTCTDTSASITVTEIPQPIAAFSFVTNQLQTTFTDLSTGASSWLWDFGDGNTSTQQNPTHAYLVSGTYSVVLIVNNNGCTDTLTQLVTVTLVGIGGEMNDEPLINIFPNPFRDQTLLEINSTQPGKLVVRIFDMLGKEIVPVQIQMITEGKSQIALSLGSEVAAGTYLIAISLNEITALRKILLMD